MSAPLQTSDMMRCGAGWAQRQESTACSSPLLPRCLPTAFISACPCQPSSGPPPPPPHTHSQYTHAHAGPPYLAVGRRQLCAGLQSRLQLGLSARCVRAQARHESALTLQRRLQWNAMQTHGEGLAAKPFCTAPPLCMLICVPLAAPGCVLSSPSPLYPI